MLAEALMAANAGGDDDDDDDDEASEDDETDGEEVSSESEDEVYTGPDLGLDGDDDDDKNAPKLDEQQQRVVTAIKVGRNVFITGVAGTGKSFLLRHLIDRVLPALGKRVYTTASTGVAGVAIGGTTLHSFAGVGLGEQPVEILIKKVKNNRFKSRSWQQADVLIVDEVSMLDAKFFEKRDKIGRAVRYQPKLPFGGIQLLLTGDFLQLPPVNKTKIKGAVFAFESDAWKNARLKNFVLEKV